MKTNSTGTPNKEILLTPKPFNFYLLVIVLLSLFISFFLIQTNRSLNGDESFSLALVLVCIGIAFYANFGQYLATVSLYEQRLEVKYIFPWNRPIIFTFQRIIELNHKDMPFQNGRSRWYVGGKWLFIKNEMGQTCQFKYNINNSHDELLIQELRKKLP